MRILPIVLLLGVAGVTQNGAASAQASPAAQERALAQQLRPYASDWSALLHAEDSRASTASLLEQLFAGTRSEEPELRRMAVRALGRLERPELVDRIARLLGDRDAGVRAEAAIALGQAVSRGEGAAARAQLLARYAAEADPTVIAAIAETLGRTRHADGDAAATTLRALQPLLESADPVVQLGAARGFYFFVRQQNARAGMDALTRERLLRLSTAGSNAAPLMQRRLRTVAAAAWIGSAQPTGAGIASIFEDTSALVRREAVAGMFALGDSAAARTLLHGAMRDADAMVRYEGVRVYGRRFGATSCAPLLEASRDRNAHVALLAIDLLGRSCGNTAAAVQQLDAIARTLPASGENGWHHAAHALASLAAARAHTLANALLPRFFAHPDFFVRAWAAEAAGLLNDHPTLRRLAYDAHPNVRTTAVQALSKNVRHDADSIYLGQLDSDDNQLLKTTALALDSSSTAGVANRLVDALDRISALKRETMRDSRIAMLQSIRTVGDRTLTPRIQPYLTDYDSAVAALAADINGRWTGARVAASATAPPQTPLPSFDEVARWTTSRVQIEMMDGGIVELQLFPFAAPTNVARFVRLARAGHFDGLTFHRIVPNFVVQGGSPHANEYSGDGPFTRDELGTGNWRGTIGLSTRGRDTGDGQVFINLIDNVRLDHDYTVFAEVVRGMDVVDQLLEGARIRRVVITD